LNDFMMTPATSQSAPGLRIWGIRLLLAFLLLFAMEILAWSRALGTPLLEWVLLLPGYLALACGLLDQFVRYRIRDVYGVLALAGVAGLIGGAAFHPVFTMGDLPLTLASRSMGALTLLCAEVLGLLVVLCGRHGGQARLYWWLGCGIVGAAWGFWVAGWPQTTGQAPVTLAEVLAVGGLSVIVIGGLGLMLRGPLPGAALRLEWRGWSLVSLVLLGIVVYRVLSGVLPLPWLLIIGLLLLLCWSINWYRSRLKSDPLLPEVLDPPPLWSLGVAGVIFLGVAVLVFLLPPVEIAGITPVDVIALGFVGYGLGWLPLVTILLGAQGYLGQLARRKM
jgi:hypothetical protein